MGFWKVMTEVGTRDRWIMAGLVTLGLFTVIAGVLSGRSTIDYVLGRDAREAALAWSEKIDAQLRSPQSDAADSATPDIHSPSFLKSGTSRSKNTLPLFSIAGLCAAIRRL